MKKLLLFFTLIGAVVFTVIGQEVTDSTATVTYTLGDSIVEFLQKNMWTLIFVVLYLVSEWLGETAQVPEGSIWRKILNWALQLARKKGTLSPKMKAGYVKFAKTGKVMMFGIILSALSLGASAQDPWKGFFRPVDKDMFALKADADFKSSTWLFRPTVELSALQLIYNKEEKAFDASSLTSGGIGIGYQHFIEVNGEPYNNFGFNFLMLIDAIPLETTNTAISGAVTVSALKFLNVGGGYNFGIRKPFILTGVTYNFN